MKKPILREQRMSNTIEVFFLAKSWLNVNFFRNA